MSYSDLGSESLTRSYGIDIFYNNQMDREVSEINENNLSQLTGEIESLLIV